MGEEDRPKVDPKSIWDGHTASVEATTKAAQSHVTIEEQIAQIHRAQGLLPDQEKERIGPKSTAGSGELSSKDSSSTIQAPPAPAAALIAQAAFSVRPAMTATMVPVVQMTSTPVVLVQQSNLGKSYFLVFSVKDNFQSF